MAEKKDNKLKELELKVSQLANKVRLTLPAGSPAYNAAKAEYDAAVVELENYKTSKSVKNNVITMAEDYSGQIDVATIIDRYKLGLYTDDSGNIVPANVENLVNEANNITASAGTTQYVYIGRETYTPGGAEIERKGNVTSSQRPYEKGAYSRTIKVNSSFDEIKKDIITDAQRNPEGIKGLFDKLYRAGYISKTTADATNLGSDEFNRGLRSVLYSYSKDFVVNQAYGDKSKEPISFEEYLSNAKKVGTGETSYRAVATLKPDAIEDIDRFFIDFIGRSATTEEQNEYYKLLRDAEKKNVVKTTQTENSIIESGELVSAEDRLAIKRKIAGKALNGSNLDTILKTGAEASRSVSSLINDARQYGIILSSKEAVDLVAKDLSAGRLDEKAMKSRLVQISKANYSNLSELSDEISVKDLSRNLIMTMGEVLELDPNGIDVLDPTIQKALKNNGNKGIMSLTDFEIMLRNDPRWAKTKNAKEEASSYGYEILKSFGLMA